MWARLLHRGYLQGLRPHVSFLAFLIILALAGVASPASASVIPPIGPIGDDFNYTAADPDCTKWDCDDPLFQECFWDLGTHCHDMSVSNPPGYLFSQAYCDSNHLANGCELDARLTSKQTLSYSTSSGLNMRLTERFSPDVNDWTLCGTFTSADHGYKRMHVISLQYSIDDPATDVVEPGVELWLNVHHDCNIDGWKFYVSSRYTDASGNPHDFEPFSDRVLNANDWLDLTIEVRDNGQNTLLTAKNLSTGITYSKSISSWIGTRSLPVKIATQYRHNERSRTDFVDFRLTQNDCGSLTDAGDSFGGAMQMPNPTACDGSLAPSTDGEDWYWHYVDIGKKVEVIIASGPLVSFYRPDGSFAASCTGTCIHSPTEQSGNWRIRIHSGTWGGTYSFTLSIKVARGGGGCGDGCYPV